VCRSRSFETQSERYKHLPSFYMAASANAVRLCQGGRSTKIFVQRPGRKVMELEQDDTASQSERPDPIEASPRAGGRAL